MRPFDPTTTLLSDADLFKEPWNKTIKNTILRIDEADPDLEDDFKSRDYKELISKQVHHIVTWLDGLGHDLLNDDVE